jgi:hypothetical protein
MPARCSYDVNSIELGDDFVDVITAAVGSCDVLLVLIGDQWVRSSTEITARSVYLVTLLLLCCGMRFGSRGGPTPCRLADGDLMIQQQTHDAYPVGRSGLIAQLGGVMRRLAVSAPGD